MKYTEGPWAYVSDIMKNDCLIVKINNAGGLSFSEIATINKENKEWSRNVLLISSAPQLYEALKSVEWGGQPVCGRPTCPSCHNKDEEGHKKYCVLYLALNDVTQLF